MTQQEYEQKREQEWRAFCNRHGIIDRGHVILFSAFFDAFDRAYALGREKEIISQDEIDKAAEDYVSFKKGGKCMLSYIIGRACLRAFKGGANFAFGKQEKDAEGEELLTCEKSKAMQLYSHLLDLVENERMSEHYSKWCDLEREYIALFGENVVADHFGSKCLPNAHEDNFATKKPEPAETKNEGTRQEQCVPKNAESGTHSFSHILKDSFQNERRLNIAAQIVASMIGSDDWTTWRGGSNKEIWHNMAKSSLEIADALIDECEKGGE